MKTSTVMDAPIVTIILVGLIVSVCQL